MRDNKSAATHTGITKINNDEKDNTSQLLKNFEKPKVVHSFIKDDIWGADLADMQ